MPGNISCNVCASGRLHNLADQRGIAHTPTNAYVGQCRVPHMTGNKSRLAQLFFFLRVSIVIFGFQVIYQYILPVRDFREGKYRSENADLNSFVWPHKAPRADEAGDEPEVHIARRHY